ncbi:MAG: ribonuclease P protein component [Lentisphaeria bacterium]
MTLISKQRKYESGKTGRSFGPDARLRNRKMIDAVKTGGIQFTGKYSVILVKTAPPDKQCRASFLISRRFSLLAVRRNRARRLYRETFRLLFYQLRPCWILMIPRRKIQTAKMQDVYLEVKKFMSRSALLMEE